MLSFEHACRIPSGSGLILLTSSGQTKTLQLSNSIKFSITGLAYSKGLFVTIPKDISLLFKKSKSSLMPSKIFDEVVKLFLYSSNSSCL